MGIADEVGKEMGEKPAARFRKLMIEMDGARRYFERWRQETALAKKELRLALRRVDDANAVGIQAERRAQDAESAAEVMQMQLEKISEYIRDYFPDVYEVEKTNVVAGENMVTLSHGEELDEKPRHVDAQGNKPTTVAEQAIYLMGELKKIRAQFGGTPTTKANRLIGEQV